MLLVYAQNTATVATVAAQRLTAVGRNERCLRLSCLMEASELQLQRLARRGSVEEARVAQRILECPMTFQSWEYEHTDIMRGVALAPRMAEQKRRLLAATLALLHRKSLFEYLRDHQVHDRQRERLLMHFHSGNDYARAMVSEHGNYLRSAASYLCATHLGLRLLNDSLFAGPLDEYAILYARYFATYAKLLLSRKDADSRVIKLAQKLKSHLGQRRRSLLNVAQTLH